MSGGNYHSAAQQQQRLYFAPSPPAGLARQRGNQQQVAPDPMEVRADPRAAASLPQDFQQRRNPQQDYSNGLPAPPPPQQQQPQGRQLKGGAPNHFNFNPSIAPQGGQSRSAGRAVAQNHQDHNNHQQQQQQQARLQHSPPPPQHPQQQRARGHLSIAHAGEQPVGVASAPHERGGRPCEPCPMQHHKHHHSAAYVAAGQQQCNFGKQQRSSEQNQMSRQHLSGANLNNNNNVTSSLLSHTVQQQHHHHSANCHHQNSSPPRSSSRGAQQHRFCLAEAGRELPAGSSSLANPNPISHSHSNSGEMRTRNLEQRPYEHEQDDEEYANQLRRSQLQQRIGHLQQQQGGSSSSGKTNARAEQQQQQMHFANHHHNMAGQEQQTNRQAAGNTQTHKQQVAAGSSSTSPRESLHVNFNRSSQSRAGQDDEEGESTRKKKYLTAKYGQQQMNLIKKRLKIEMWLHEQLQQLAALSPSSANVDPDELDEIDIDLDQLLDMDDDSTRRQWLRKTLEPLGELPRDSMEKFICDVLEQSKLL